MNWVVEVPHDETNFFFRNSEFPIGVVAWLVAGISKSSAKLKRVPKPFLVFTSSFSEATTSFFQERNHLQLLSSSHWVATFHYSTSRPPAFMLELCLWMVLWPDSFRIFSQCGGVVRQTATVWSQLQRTSLHGTGVDSDCAWYLKNTISLVFQAHCIHFWLQKKPSTQ